MLLWRVIPELCSALAVELPELIITSWNRGIFLSPRFAVEADVARWPPAEPIGSSVSSRLADSVCYSFPPTADKDSLKGSLPWLFITETMPPQSVIPKARESRTPSSSSKVKYPEEGQFGAARLQGALRTRAEIFPKTMP